MQQERDKDSIAQKRIRQLTFDGLGVDIIIDPIRNPNEGELPVLPSFSPSQQIHPVMVGRWAENSDFSAQDPPLDPNERNSIRAFFCLSGKHIAHSSHHTRNHGVNILTCCSRCRLKSNKFPHPPNQIFVVGLSCGIVVFQPSPSLS